MSPEHLASTLGARPLTLFVVLVVVALVAVVGLFVTMRLSERYARALWRTATRLWKGIAAGALMQQIERRLPIVGRVMRSLSATEYLIVHVVIGFAIALGLIGFLSLADAVSERETLVHVDLALATSLHASASPASLEVFGVFTVFGSGIGIALIGVAVGFVLLRKGRRLLALGWTIALVGVGVLNFALKAAFARPRPVLETGLTFHGWSFPSGHSMGTWVTAGMLVYLGLLFFRSPSTRLTIAAAAVVWSVAMGFSRLILGAHYLSDVLGGFAAGTVWLGACISGLEVARRRPINGPS